MLCQNCKKKEAAFYYKQNINGNVSEVHLCADCAKKYSSGNQLPDIFGIDLLGGLFGVGMPAPAVQKKTHVCPECGCSIDDIARTGKVGCAECYNTFSDELRGMIERIHGRVRHIGRGVKKEKQEKENREKDLKEQLAKAISEENYELAAKLRDEIRALDKKDESEDK